MDISNTLLDFFGVMPGELVICYAWTKMLHMRSNKAFWVAMVCAMFLILTTRSYAGSELRLVNLVLSYGVLPFIMSDDKPIRKVFSIAFVNIVVMIAEVAGFVIWYALTNLDTFDYASSWAHLGEYALVHAAHICILAVLFSGLYAALHRDARDMAESLRLFVLFPIMQTVLIALPLAVTVYLHRGSGMLYYGAAALVLICLIADFALFRSIERFGRKQSEDQRANMLQQQLSEYLASYDRIVGEVERTAYLRHDLRNQAQTVLLLSEKGDTEQARAHLAAFRQQLG